MGRLTVLFQSSKITRDTFGDAKRASDQKKKRIDEARVIQLLARGIKIDTGPILMRAKGHRDRRPQKRGMQSASNPFAEL